jgi:hypothetical protein
MGGHWFGSYRLAQTDKSGSVRVPNKPVSFETASVADPNSSLNKPSSSPSPSTTGPFNSPGNQSIPGQNGTITGTGDVTQPPPVPGGSGTPGKGVTAVNTAAMKTFAQNLASLADTGGPLYKLVDYLNQVNVKPGGFRSAQNNVAQPVMGTGKLRDESIKMVHDLIDSINTASDKMSRAALAYETADAANNMSSTDFSNYFGQLSTDINNIGSKGA